MSLRGMVTLDQRDELRAKVLQELDKGAYDIDQAAQLLQVTPRQAWRLLAAYRQDGVRSVPHGNRGRPPKHALSPTVTAAALELLRCELKGCNNQHAAELLLDRGVSISASTVRRLRLTDGLDLPRTRRSRKHRTRRERKSQPGMMLQLDGSLHHWLGAGLAQFALVAAIDDATGEVFGRFKPHEDLMGYLALLKDIIRRKGMPLSVYSDRHTIFRSPKADRLTIDEQLAGVKPRSQFGRACDQLGITMITAHSPQAKGRVENLFGTLQDRLVQELQIASIKDMAQAQRFLPGFLKRYNKRFNKPALNPESAYRPPAASELLTQALCMRFERVVANDHTVSFAGRRLQLPKARRSYAGQKVALCISPEGLLTYWYQGELLGSGPRLEGRLLADLATLATALPPAPDTPPADALPKAKPHHQPGTAVTPSADHPWRKPYKSSSPPSVVQ